MVHAGRREAIEGFLGVFASLGHLQLDELLARLLREARVALDVDLAGILFADPAGTHLDLKAVDGARSPDALPKVVPRGQWFGGRVMASGQPLVLEEQELQGVVHPALLAEGIRTLVGVPLLLHGRVVGVLILGCRQRRGFGDPELELAGLVANHAAVAIDHARLLEQERRLREQAEKETRFKADLLHMTSHDLKTPLTAMQLQLALLRAAQPPLDAKRATAVTILERNLNRLQLMLDDMLDLARMEAGTFVLDFAEVDLSHVVRQAGEIFGPKARANGLAYREQSEAGLVVQGDERRLAQVMANLLSNAVRYTGKGGVEVRAERDGKDACITVKDTGRGMTQEQLARLFQPFTQVHGSREERKGTGLGLYLSKAIVEQHGGTLRLASQGPDQGTTAEVRIPLADAA